MIQAQADLISNTKNINIQMQIRAYRERLDDLNQAYLHELMLILPVYGVCKIHPSCSG